MSTNNDNNDSGARSGSTFDRHIARLAVGGYVDMQGLRTAQYNRVRDIIRKKNEDIPFDVVEAEKDRDEEGWDSEYDDDALPDLIDEMLKDGRLTSHEHQYLVRMLDAAEAAEALENRYKSLFKITESEPIYHEWLDNVYGVSTTLTAKLIHQFGYCEDFDKVSQLWSYSGLAPGQRRRRGEKLGYSSEAKTLAWNVADCMIKQGKRSEFRRRFYDPYKAEQLRRMEESSCRYCGESADEHPSVDRDGSSVHVCPDDADQVVESSDFDVPDAGDEATPPWRKGHADARARRYLAKKFLKHYWMIARDIEGLDVPEEWVVTHGGHEEQTDSFENPLYAKQLLRSTRSEA